MGVYSVLSPLGTEYENGKMDSELRKALTEVQTN